MGAKNISQCPKVFLHHLDWFQCKLPTLQTCQTPKIVQMTFCALSQVLNPGPTNGRTRSWLPLLSFLHAKFVQLHSILTASIKILAKYELLQRKSDW